MIQVHAGDFITATLVINVLKLEQGTAVPLSFDGDVPPVVEKSTKTNNNMILGTVDRLHMRS